MARFVVFLLASLVFAMVQSVLADKHTEAPTYNPNGPCRLLNSTKALEAELACHACSRSAESPERTKTACLYVDPIDADWLTGQAFDPDCHVPLGLPGNQTAECHDCYTRYQWCAGLACGLKCEWPSAFPDTSCKCCAESNCRADFEICSGLSGEFYPGLSCAVEYVSGAVDLDAKAHDRNATVAGSIVGVLCAFTAFVLFFSGLGVLGV